jgi:hypothetical protein
VIRSEEDTGRCHLIVVVRLLICSIWRPNITAFFGINDTTLFVHQFNRSSNDLVPTIGGREKSLEKIEGGDGRHAESGGPRHV